MIGSWGMSGVPTAGSTVAQCEVLSRLLDGRCRGCSLSSLARRIYHELYSVGPSDGNIAHEYVRGSVRCLRCRDPFLISVRHCGIPDAEKRAKGSCVGGYLQCDSPSCDVFGGRLASSRICLLERTLSLLNRFSNLPGLRTLRDLQGKLSRGRYRQDIVSFAGGPVNSSGFLKRLFATVSGGRIISVDCSGFNSSRGMVGCHLCPCLLGRCGHE